MSIKNGAFMPSAMAQRLLGASFAFGPGRHAKLCASKMAAASVSVLRAWIDGMLANIQS